MGSELIRDCPGAAGGQYDLVVIGGGIHGAMALLEAARRGLHALLVERGDFGCGTSQHSLRILHGGLRYLQSADLPRFHRSVTARREMVRRYPDLARPLGCLMPLYGQGMRRRSVMRAALGMNDLLGMRRNEGVEPRAHLPRSRTLGAAETGELYPAVPRAGLEGSALWHDHLMLSSERIIIETLRRAAALGANALNYCSAEALLPEGSGIRGVKLHDRIARESFEVRASSVLDVRGHRAGRQMPGNPRDQSAFQSIACNVLLDRAPPSAHALAVAAPRPGAQMLFVVPRKSATWVGTIHLPCKPGESPPADAVVPERAIDELINEINSAMPGFRIDRDNVRRVTAGYLPVEAPGSTRLTSSERIVDFSAHGGPEGCFGLQTIKFTTACVVAREAVDRVLPRAISRRPHSPTSAPESAPPPLSASSIVTDWDAARSGRQTDVARQLADCVRQESVACIDDLVLRRTNWSTTECDLDAVYDAANRLLAMEGLRLPRTLHLPEEVQR